MSKWNQIRGWRIPSALAVSFMLGLIASALSGALNHASSNNTLPIIQQKKAFQPGEVSISQGDALLFKNQDSSAHNIVSRSPAFDFDLGLQEAGEDRSMTFAKTGLFEVGCNLHPKMKLMVTVK